MQVWAVEALGSPSGEPSKRVVIQDCGECWRLLWALSFLRLKEIHGNNKLTNYLEPSKSIVIQNCREGWTARPSVSESFHQSKIIVGSVFLIIEEFHWNNKLTNQEKDTPGKNFTRHLKKYLCITFTNSQLRPQIFLDGAASDFLHLRDGGLDS